jgi:hypothetical protein
MPRRRLAALIGAAAVLVAGGVGGGLVIAGGVTGDGGGGGIGTANLFVTTSGGTSSCTRQAGPRTFADAPSGAKCDSFDAANDHCQNGDTVLVEAGSYSAQRVTGANGRTSMCTIEADTGQTVTLAALDTQGDWLTVRGMSIPTTFDVGGHAWTDSGSHIVGDDLDATGPEATVLFTDLGGTKSPTDITWKNSNMGTPGNTTIRRCATGNGAPFQIDGADNVTLLSIDFWQFFPDQRATECGSSNGMHLEDVRINGGSNNARLNRVRFHDGSGDGSARIFVSGPGSDDLRVVNSWLGVANGANGNPDNAVVLAAGGGTCTGYVFAYDSWVGGMNDSACPVKPAYYGDMATVPSYLACPGRAAAGNLWTFTDTKSACPGSSWIADRLATTSCSQDADPYDCFHAYKVASDHWHLTAMSPAINAGENAQCTMYAGDMDIDGRPRIGVCDVGPDEYGN